MTTTPRLSPWPTGPSRRAHQALRVLAAAVDLVRRGAIVRAARLLPEPAVVIAAPPPGLLSTYAYVLDGADGAPRTGHATGLGGVRILWTPAPAPRAALPRS